MLLTASCCFSTIFAIFLITRKQKTYSHHFFLLASLCLAIWSFENTITRIIQEPFVRAYYFSFTAISLLPVFCLLLSLSFLKPNFKLEKKYKYLFIIPFINLALLYTSDFHNLFFIEHKEYGYFFYLHSIYSYICLITSVYYFLRFAKENAGLFSKQALLISIAVISPIIPNLAYLFISSSGNDNTPIAFTITILLLWFAYAKYDMLKIVPIAHEKIINHISDAFAIVDEEYNFLEYNDSFEDVFSCKILKQNTINIFDLISNPDIILCEKNNLKLKLKLKNILEEQSKLSYGACVIKNNAPVYFNVDINPLYSLRSYRGSVIIFKNITEQKKKFEITKENEARLLRTKKFSFLGEVTGGLTHIIKNKISSIGYYTLFFENAFPRYYNLLDKAYEGNISDKKREAYEGVEKRIEAIKNATNDIDMLITNVKQQILELGKDDDTSNVSSFSLNEFLHRINSFVQLEAKEQGIFIDIELEENLDDNLQFKGLMGILIQAIMNLFSNSMYEYKKNNIKEKIILKIQKSKDDNFVEFHVVDFGQGLPEVVKSNLFSKVITTKGEEGTGIGLYATYSAIKDRLNGTIESIAVDKGTTFVIKLPIYNTEV